jgi:O-antigen ligase
MIFFYLLVLSLPFVDHGLLAREVAGLTLEKFMGAICFCYALSYLPRRVALPSLFASRQAKAFAVYVGVTVISYLTMSDAINFQDLVGIFLSQFVFFVTVMILLDSRERIQSTLLVLAASMGLISLYLIREWVANLGEYGFSYRPGWVAGDPNMFCASALIALPLMFFSLAYAERVWQRAGVVACIALTVFSFFLASSRGGFIGVMAMFLWQLRVSRRRFGIIALCAAVLVVCAVSPYSPLDRLLKPTESDTESSNIRLQLWSVSGKIFVDHPVFGVGPMNFPKYMHRYLPPGVDLDFVVPHSTYLESVVETGAIGLLAFLCVIGLTLQALERMRHIAIAAGDAYFSALASVLGSGLIGFAVAALFLSAKHDKLFWFAVFLSACLQPLLAQSVAAAREKLKADKLETTPPKATATTPPKAPVTLPAKVPVAAKHVPMRVGNWLTRH